MADTQEVLNFNHTLSTMVDLIKKGETKAPVDYFALAQTIRDNRDSIVQGYKDKMTLNSIEIDELTEESSVDKFALKRLDVKKAQIERAVKTQYMCAGGDLSNRVMASLVAGDGCAAVQAIVSAASLNNASLADSAEYQAVLQEIEDLTEGENSARIKALKEQNEAYQETIDRINKAIEKFLASASKTDA